MNHRSAFRKSITAPVTVQAPVIDSLRYIYLQSWNTNNMTTMLFDTCEKEIQGVKVF